MCEERIYKNRDLKYGCIAVLCLMTLALGGCSHKVTADISSYEEAEITVSGITGEDMVVTPREMAELKCADKTVTSKSGKRTVTVRAVGPTLDTFLESLGTSKEQWERILFIAEDGYTKEFDCDFFLTHSEVILAVADGGEPLDEDERPVRLVIPGTTPDLWVRGVTKICVE